MTTSTITAGDGATGMVHTGAIGNDGSLIIQTGAAGAKVNAISLAADGTLTFLKVPTVTAVQSMIRLNTANGYGSTNTMIRRMTNVVTNQGADITYVDSATLGGTFTINTAGVYAITESVAVASDSDQGISLNSSQLSTDIAVITVADRLAMSRSGATVGANIMMSFGWTGFLSAGSIIRIHGDAVGINNPAFMNFTITRIA
jgi:hypothetical protein